MNNKILYKITAGSLIILIVEDIASSLAAFIYFILNEMSKPHWVAKISIISSSIIIALAFLLIAYLGMQGASIALLVYTVLANFIAVHYSQKSETLNNISIALLLSISSYLLLIRATSVATRSELIDLLQSAYKISGIRVEQR